MAERGVADERIAYPPLDEPKPVAADLWVVDAAPIALVAGLRIPVRMTVIRIGGALLLHSPTGYSESLRDRLAALGTIRHLIAPSLAHWMFVAAWQRAIPDATVWAPPGLAARRQVRAAGLRIDRELGDAPPPEWGGVVDQWVIPGAFGYHEIAFLHRPSRTLILTDLVQGFEPARLPKAMGAAVRLLGNDGGTPLHLRAVLWPQRAAVAVTARGMLDAAPERLVVTHGRWFATDATAVVRRAVRWVVH